MLFTEIDYLENQNSSKTKKPRVFNLPPTKNFAFNFVKGLLNRFNNSVWRDQPEFLSKCTILTANQRTAAIIKEVFSKAKVTHSPRVFQIQDLSGFLGTSITKNYPEFEFFHRGIITNLERFIIIEQLAVDFLQENSDFRTKAISYDIASTAENLIDEFNANNLSLEDINGLDSDDLSKNSKASIETLKYVFKHYIEYQSSSNRIDLSYKHSWEISCLLNHWRTKPPKDPIIVVGSTGSRNSTANLMKAVSQFQQGAVILPGLDKFLPEEAWKILTPDHPQYGYVYLAKRWGLQAKDLKLISKSPIWYPCNKLNTNQRLNFFSLAFRPAALIHSWVSEGNLLTKNLKKIMAGVTLIEADNTHIEAKALALAIRDSVRKNLSVALITPDVNIGRFVTSELERWDIIPNNSLGQSLDKTKEGIFVSQTLMILSKDFTIGDLIVMLRNPIYPLREVEAHNKNICRLEEATICDEKFSECCDFYLEWAANQDSDFSSWVQWLFGLFQPKNLFSKTSPLSEFVKIHEKFIEELLLGPTKFFDGDSVDNNSQFFWNTENGCEIKNEFQTLKTISKKIRKVNFSEYKLFLEKFLKSKEVYKNSSEKDTVFIWGALEARCQSADVFILAGLNEGIWPKNEKNSIWLNRMMGTKFSLDFNARKIGLSAHDFQQFSMAKKLILSRSTELENGPSIASRWLFRIEYLLKSLGSDGTQSLRILKKRGSRLLKRASGLNDKNIQFSALPSALFFPASRPAPIPPKDLRPRKIPLTQLSNLIINPYSIYAKYILKLNKIEARLNFDDPRFRGILMHKIMESFVKSTLEDLPNDSNSRALLIQIFDNIVEKHFIPSDLISFWKRKFEHRIPHILQGEKIRRARANPFAQEAFGKLVLRLADGDDFVISGRIDRIDISSDGFWIYDYKTGVVSRENLTKYSPQLDVEAMMLQSGSVLGLDKSEVIGLSLVGLGGDAKEITNLINKKDLKTRYTALRKYLDNLICHNSPFVAEATDQVAGNDYKHLSRYGEWSAVSRYQEVILEKKRRTKD